MKREDLRELGLTDEQVDAVMKQHHVELDKNSDAVDKLATIQTERDQLQEQLKERDKDLAKLQKQSKDNEEVSTQLADLKSKYDESSKQWEAEKSRMKLDVALESQLSQTNAKDTAVLKKLLNMDEIKLNDDGHLDGLQDQVTQLSKENPYLFNGPTQQGYQPVGGSTVSYPSDLQAAMKQPDFNLTKFMEQNKGD
ncbi:phage scaffolding protein [Fructobacillus tropaeoli]|uniref:Phage minor structural protein GP20 n=1 Tax=Fructobacillus tropaeoli TaxID=709323 RepID=A0A3F3H1I2_9LACO|nr:phage scaffolding protein [Fructobacillus tropaeoli]GAP04891.1 hypothetical protein FTRO_0110260 [Fructobacillus tropaeoli]